MFKLKIQRLIWFILLLFFMFQPALSQEGEKPEPGLVITSVPSGVTVFFEGEFNLTVTTPATLPLSLRGRYKIKALKEGYEDWSTNIWLDGTTSKLLSITLVPKTRLKGALRSAFIPGWGQYYYGEKKKAFLFSLSTLGTVIAYVVADADFSDKNDAYIQAKNDYNSARSTEEKFRLKQVLDLKQREAYDAENLRRTTLVLLAAAWGFNFIDALVFFPTSKDGLSISSSISLAPEDREVKLSLIKKF